LILVLGWNLNCFAQDVAGRVLPQGEKPFAVVELFTSQGCSSCPRADALLNRLAEEATMESVPIYTLSHHVDYWNYLGWKDPYSSEKSTARQRVYSRVFGKRGPYTPQLIINGADVVPALDEDLIRGTIKKHLLTPTQALLSFRSHKLEEGQVLVSYALGNIPANLKLQAFLIDSPPKNFVGRGENAGKIIKHSNVVRDFKTFEATPNAEGQIGLDFRKGLDLDSIEVLGILHDPTTMKIYAADKISLDLYR
jgi:hypothetical protein